MPKETLKNCSFYNNFYVFVSISNKFQLIVEDKNKTKKKKRSHSRKLKENRLEPKELSSALTCRREIYLSYLPTVYLSITFTSDESQVVADERNRKKKNSVTKTSFDELCLPFMLQQMSPSEVNRIRVTKKKKKKKKKMRCGCWGLE